MGSVLLGQGKRAVRMAGRLDKVEQDMDSVVLEFGVSLDSRLLHQGLVVLLFNVAKQFVAASVCDMRQRSSPEEREGFSKRTERCCQSHHQSQVYQSRSWQSLAHLRPILSTTVSLDLPLPHLVAKQHLPI